MVFAGRTPTIRQRRSRDHVLAAAAERGGKPDMTAPSAGPLRLGIVQIDAVPQAMSEYGRLWGPAEPLASSADFSEALSTSRFFAAAAGANARNILSRIHSIATIEMKQLLSEILAFVDEQDADVMVFP